LNSLEKEEGLILICDDGGTVRKILHDTVGFKNRELEGRPFTAILDRSSMEKALNFLLDLQNRDPVFNWQMTVSSKRGLMNLFFAGLQTARNMLVIASPTRMGQFDLFDSITGPEGRGEITVKPALQERVRSMRAGACQDERIFEDLTRLNNELANLQRELHKKNTELKKLDRLKNQFLGMAAHDLRSPLVTITMYIEYLTDELRERLSEEELQYFDAIRSTSGYMLELVNNLLDLSTIESGNLSLNLVRGDILESVNHALAMSRAPAARKGVDIVLRAVENLPDVVFDRIRIEQVLNNLLDNAVKFSHPGGRVTVDIRREKGNVLLAVEDEGCGIADHDLRHLFTGFKRKSSRGTKGERGSGLGLAIAHKIVTEHGGRIEVESEVGRGSIFSVRLPAEGPSPRRSVNP
jgi:signal transduction histidine kinase